MSLPARCEVLRNIYLDDSVLNDKNINEIFVPNQEISNGIFIASTIISKQNPYVNVLNTTSENIFLQNVKIKTENIANYNIHYLKNTQTKNQTEILQKLSKNFPLFAKEKLTTLCTEFIDIFSLETDKITSNNFYKQKFKLKDNSPVYIKNYRIPHVHKEIIEKEVKKLQEDGIIEPSISEYNSPVLLVPKKPIPGSTEKRWRLVIDYRQVNKKLIGDKYPLPRIDDILDQLGRAKFFSNLDLIQGFLQIDLDEDSKDITSFSTDKGSFRFNRLPYGIKVAPNSFQRMMSLAFAGLTPEKAFLYMDDIVVIGKSHVTKP